MLGASLLCLLGGPALAGFECPEDGCFGDANGDGMVAVNEVILAVNNLLNGCPPPQGELGTRVFTIAPVSASLRTALFSSALLNNNVASTFTEGPLRIVGGTPDEDGVAPLSLAEDASFAVRVVDTSIACFRLLAEGSGGSIDCDGGTPYDVIASAEAGEDAPSMLTTGQGDDGGPGAATLLVMIRSAQLPAGSSFDDCATAGYTDPSPTAFTTAMATASKGALEPLSKDGENFDCAAFATTDGPGVLVSPSAAFAARAGGDLVNVMSVADN